MRWQECGGEISLQKHHVRESSCACMVSSYLKEQKGKKRTSIHIRYYLETCKLKKKYIPMSSTTHTKSNHNATKKTCTHEWLFLHKAIRMHCCSLNIQILKKQLSKYCLFYMHRCFAADFQRIIIR